MDQVEQRYIPWNPVPEGANQTFELGVGAFVSRLRGGLEEVSIVAFAPKPAPPGAGYVALDYWRITFERAAAFRWGPSGDWPASPGRHPDKDAGAWEVRPLRWIAEELPPFVRAGMHHYAITYDEDLYEGIVDNCSLFATSIGLMRWDNLAAVNPVGYSPTARDLAVRIVAHDPSTLLQGRPLIVRVLRNLFLAVTRVDTDLFVPVFMIDTYRAGDLAAIIRKEYEARRAADRRLAALPPTRIIV